MARERCRQLERLSGKYQTTANINEQNAINAYNARTQVYGRPQQVNVNHSGYINHNVNGRVNVYGY